MDHLGTLSLFMQAADSGSFVAAGKLTGHSASAVGKAVARLEQSLGVRLFHRNTRSMKLTDEGRLLLDRCRRIFDEVSAAEMELTQSTTAPSGRLRVSLPLVGMLLMPVMADFVAAYPTILLDLDFSDRLVDVIEEGFDAVIRTGAATDSRLMRRSLGRFQARIVASPTYLAAYGTPTAPVDLMEHRCLRQRASVSGKLAPWPVEGLDPRHDLPESMTASAIEPLIHLAERGLGIACLPPFAVSDQLRQGRLVAILDEYVQPTGEMAVLWPTNRQLSPRIRAFLNFLSERLQIDQ